MCGRMVLFRLARFTDLFPWIRAFDPALDASPRYNVAPTQRVAAIANDEASKVVPMHWGLIPSWAKDASVGNRMINARVETLAEKPAFRSPLAKRRCLVLADGFYEWKTEGKSKQPMYIRRADDRPIAFAGLWERWNDPASGQLVRSCTVITTAPNELMASIHNRMPAILPEEKWQWWIDGRERSTEELIEVAREPFPASEMAAHPVGKSVGNPRAQGEELIEPAAPIVEPEPRRATTAKRSRRVSDDGPGLFG